MILAVIHLPLWSVPATVVVLCFAPDCARWLRKRLRARTGEASRLRALNVLWFDEVGGSRVRGALEAGRCSLNSGISGSRQQLHAVSPRPAATDAGGLGDAA